MTDLYQVLGVATDADQATITRRFKELARQFHPDRNGGPVHAERFKEISAAYNVLSDPEKRELYDNFGEISLRAGFDRETAKRILEERRKYPDAPAGPPPPPPPPAGHSTDDFRGFAGYGRGGEQLDKVFGDLFGGGFKEGEGFFGQDWVDRNAEDPERGDRVEKAEDVVGRYAQRSTGKARREPGWRSTPGNLRSGVMPARPASSSPPRQARTNQGGGGIHIGERPAARRGDDLDAVVQIDLLEALRGCRRAVSTHRPRTCAECGGSGRGPGSACPDCGGHGTMSYYGPSGIQSRPCFRCDGSGAQRDGTCRACGGSGKSTGSADVMVDIPPGVGDRQIVRISGEGRDGRHGGLPGDLVVRVEISDHPLLHREGDDLLMDLAITVLEALEGATVEVPTPSGRVRVKVPANAVNGQRLRLRGQGVGGRGDLFLVLRPTLPRTADPEALRLARELERFYVVSVRSDLDL